MVDKRHNMVCTDTPYPPTYFTGGPYPFYPPNRGGKLVTKEYVIFKDANTADYNYMEIDSKAGTSTLLSQIDFVAHGMSVSDAVCTDGESVFLASQDWDGAAYKTYRFTVNGTTWTKRTNVGFTGDTSSNLGVHYDPSNPGYLIKMRGNVAAGGLSTCSYTAGSPWTYGTPTSEAEAADNWGAMGDVRVDNAGTNGTVGDHWFTIPNVSNTQYCIGYDFSGSTINQNGGANDVQSYSYCSASGWDRDTGAIYLCGSSKTNIRVLQMNMETGAIGVVGNTSALASNITGACGVNGIVVLRLPSNTIATYTLSGTTLSAQIDSITLGGTSSLNGTMRVSPYSDLVYLNAGGDLYVLEVDTNGNITQKVHDATYGIASSNNSSHKIAFIGKNPLTEV